MGRKNEHEFDVQRAELEVQNEALIEAQRSLEESRDRYSDLFEFAPIAYVTISSKGIIHDMNLVATSMLGMAREHATGFPFATFVHPAHRSRFWDYMAHLRRETFRLTTDLDLRLRGKAERLHVQIITAPASNHAASGEFRMTILDLTDRKLAEERSNQLVRESARREEVERASHAKDEFFSTLAHELRTPLNAVYGWIHLLATGRLSSAEAEHAIEVIKRNVQVQVTVINDMLDVSRIVRGSLELRVRPMNLGEILQVAMDALRPMAQTKGVQVGCTADPIATSIYGDPDRLYQVLSNLLSNAIKFTPGGGSVSIRLERGVWSNRPYGIGYGECARVTVRDTGAGIPVEDLPHVFEPFRKGRETRSVDGGLGLGLTIARKLVEMHGGSIRVTSEGRGQGTEFVVELPIGHASHPPRGTPAEVPPPREGRDLTGIVVLMADDDPDARELTRRMLEPLGAAVTTVPSAPEAFEAFRSSKPDILVSDLAMPEEDGISLIRRIRSLSAEEGGRTPAIALTAHAGAGDEDRVIAAGFQTFVAKPVDPRKLAGLIGSLVDLSRRTHS